MTWLDLLLWPTAATMRRYSREQTKRTGARPNDPAERFAEGKRNA